MKILSQLIKIQLKGLFLGSADNKKTKAIIMTILYIYVGGYFLFLFGLFFDMLVSPFHAMNLDWLYFALMGIVIILMTFVGSIFMTYQMVYDSKDNEFLLSLPIHTSYILLSRLVTLYLFNLIMELAIAIPAFYIYIRDIGIGSLSVISFVCVVLTLPLFVLVLSCLLSYVLGRVLMKVNNKNLISLLLSVGFFIVYFMVVGNIQEYMFELIARGEEIANVIRQTLFPIYHMAISISEHNVVSLLIYLLCALIPSAIVFKILSVYFVRIVLSKPQQKKEKYEMKKQTSQSLYMTLIVREFKHICSNVNVFLNGCLGIIFCVIASFALFFYKNDIMSLLVYFNDTTPYLCFMMALMSTMTMIGSTLISLEGQTLWIIKVLPIQTKEILLSKLFVQCIMTIPSSFLFSISMMINFNLNIVDWILLVITLIVFNVFVGMFGLIANILLPNFNWRNEVVCVKQSMSSLIGMLGSMAIIGGIGMLYPYIDHLIDIHIYLYTVLFIVFVLDVVMYYVIITWGAKKFEAINA